MCHLFMTLIDWISALADGIRVDTAQYVKLHMEINPDKVGLTIQILWPAFKLLSIIQYRYSDRRVLFRLIYNGSAN
ncbi:hypothetical protein Pelo_12750 [Pelomyxa schiedti]|nr:hypothetical protein Pelo_12750 [Pelomyxa schiedti]